MSILCISKEREEDMHKMFLKEVKFKMARQIAKERKSKGLSQNVFSELIGVQREHIGKIETGRRNLTLDILIKSCLILEIPVERVIKAEIFQKQE